MECIEDRASAIYACELGSAALEEAVESTGLLFNSPVSRSVLRARGATSHEKSRFLNRQNLAAERWGETMLDCGTFAHQQGPPIYEAALRLRNINRAERTLRAERLIYIKDRLKQLHSRPTIADWLIATEQLRSFRAPAAAMYSKLSQQHVDA